MKKYVNKKVIIIGIILILIFFIIGVVGYTYFYYKSNPIEVSEISILQETFVIESDSVIVVLEDEEEIEDDTEDEEKPKTNSSSNKSKTSTNSTKKKNNKKSSGATSSGSTASVAPVYYTPKIEIPRTRIKYEIFSDITVKNMEKGVVIMSTTNGLNQPGNTVISGHNYMNGKLFSNNDKIQIGDLIYITDTSGQKITYSVYYKTLTDPSDANYVDRDTWGAREISLTTCTNDSSQRIVILAKET